MRWGGLSVFQSTKLPKGHSVNLPTTYRLSLIFLANPKESKVINPFIIELKREITKLKPHQSILSKINSFVESFQPQNQIGTTEIELQIPKPQNKIPTAEQNL